MTDRRDKTFTPEQETYEDAKGRLKHAFGELGHAMINPGPEWVEEWAGKRGWDWLARNPWRHWVGKILAILFWIGVYFLNSVLTLIVVGYWDV